MFPYREHLVNLSLLKHQHEQNLLPVLELYSLSKSHSYQSNSNLQGGGEKVTVTPQPNLVSNIIVENI